ncbi:MAG: 5-demethoxyubiquinol-8 5-hydroxylase UbiM [Rubrivivax sp.]|jgi:ubiquinone biosynthesis UbiH/UbiF/VisC/COQ6 family hydroxylase|nr:5-demethoxyubiquinol-8 5-hydroxylase UbiM [Rubrivivax sp.]
MQANPLSAPDIDSDVLIVGAGPAGLALSVALAQAGLRSTVLEQNDAQTLAQPPEDGRDIALTHRARRILETLNIWQRLPAEEIAPLRKAHVSNGVSPLVLPFDAEGDGHEALGWLVPNHRLREAAYAVAIECPAVRVQPDTRVSGLRRDSSCATLEVDGGPALRAPLVVAADSRFSSLRRMAGIGARMLDFGRTAIVCRVGHEKDHEGIALECFRYGNTLAVLPMAGRLASAVVTLPSDQAPEWLALDATAFAARVQKQLDSRLGAMRLAGERHSYPLVGVYAHRFAAPRFALVGDAAVGMHPVTAHGYNFGLYGVEVLARELARARRLGRDLGELAALLAYEREHRRVTWPIYVGTNAIVQLFTDDRAPARLLRGTVLGVARQLSPLRAAIARQLTGGRAQRVRAAEPRAAPP